jgi:hypothetical protein
MAGMDPFRCRVLGLYDLIVLDDPVARTAHHEILPDHPP